MASNDYGRNYFKLTKKADLMINTFVEIDFLDSDTTDDHMVAIIRSRVQKLGTTTHKNCSRCRRPV